VIQSKPHGNSYGVLVGTLNKHKMKFRSPSLKALEAAFPGHGKQLKAIFRMNREALASLPAGDRRIRECYNPPATSDVRLHCLDAELETSGVEAFQTRRGEWVEYCNAGDTYSTTILRFRGNYRIGCWGDFAERHGSKD